MCCVYNDSVWRRKTNNKKRLRPRGATPVLDRPTITYTPSISECASRTRYCNAALRLFMVKPWRRRWFRGISSAGRPSRRSLQLRATRAVNEVLLKELDGPPHPTPLTTLHYTTLHYTALHYTTLHGRAHYTTLHCTARALHYTTLHCTALHYTTLHCTTLHYTTLHYTTLHYTTLHYTTLHYTALHYTTLHYTALHYTTLHYTALHYTTLHCTTLHYTTLHCTTLHYTTLHCTALHYASSAHRITGKKTHCGERQPTGRRTTGRAILKRNPLAVVVAEVPL